MDQLIFSGEDANISSYLEGWGGLDDQSKHQDEIHHEEVHTELGCLRTFAR
jgi:hypothetical protein